MAANSPSGSEELLERALLDAHSDPAMRQEFYRRLIASEVYLVSLGDAPMTPDGVIMPEAEVRLQVLEREGTSFVAFYSSASRLKEFNGPDARAIRLKARELFEMVRSAAFVMNPGATASKEFVPDEISALLDGSIFARVEERRVATDTEIMIGQPAVRPSELIARLTELFARYRTIRRASLAQYADPAREPEPGLLIYLEQDERSDRDDILRDVGATVESVPKTQAFVDCVFSDQAPSLSGYFNSLSPFYERRSEHD